MQWDNYEVILDLHEELSTEDSENISHPTNIAKIHYKPTQEEIDEHEVSHYPWRAWCSCCVRGAAPYDPHYGVQDRKLTRPTLCTDYSFLSSSGQETEGTMPILNIKDLVTKRVAMEVVPRKGNNEYAGTRHQKRTGTGNFRPDRHGKGINSCEHEY